jgi:dihydroorotate dehydrogenase electron transfer subunit
MNSHPKEVKARILLHRRIGPDYFRLRLLCPEIARLARPGQFVMLRINELRDPFLRRPFSFSRIFPPQEREKRLLDEGGLEICYQVVGRGTSFMTHLPEGQRLDLLGPLGRGFWTEEGQTRAILVGGGMGIAPLLSWAQELRGGRRRKGAKVPGEGAEVMFLMGGKTREKVLGIPQCRNMGLEYLVATEDGSLGVEGTATDLLERELLSGRTESAVLYACGPMSMLSRIAQMADQFDLPCQVLLESRMACGIGACLGCTVKVREGNLLRGDRPDESSLPAGKASPEMEGECGAESRKEALIPVISEGPPFRYARACKEGPVFDTREIVWE